MRRFLSHPHLPIVLLILTNLAVGGATFRDYGASWDEPLFYAYADAVGYAYSIPARLAGDFDIERAYGPSAADHRIYGPAYLLPGRLAALLIERALGVDRYPAWHLVNFLTFQAGVLALYALCLRWLNRWASFAAALLFSTQPVLWGHAFINPKDLPFMVGFLITILLGFRMVDAVVEPPEVSGPQTARSDSPQPKPVSDKGWALSRRLLQIAGFGLGLFALATLALPSVFEQLVGGTVQAFYRADPGSLAHRVFVGFAADASRLPEEFYVERALELFSQGSVLAVLLSAVLVPAALYLTLRPSAARLDVQSMLAAFRHRLRTLRLGIPRGTRARVLRAVLVPGIALGLLTSTRVIGPWAGVLVLADFLIRDRPRSVLVPILYAVIAAAVCYASWPYLWGEPIGRFLEVARHMSDNPHVLPVLFGGEVLASDALPVSYLPTLLGITLSEPVWPLFLGGAVLAFLALRRASPGAASLMLILAWSAIPFGYVLLTRPPFYDGYRHFLFLLPPIFVICGVAVQALLDRLRAPALRGVVLLLVTLPAIVGGVQLHPYQYTYYNSLAGGAAGASRRYETDFWLTCYKETLEALGSQDPNPRVLFVLRQPPIARLYAPDWITVEPFEPEADATFPGSWLLLTTRANTDLAVHPGDPVLLSIGRAGAVFCVVKQVP